MKYEPKMYVGHNLQFPSTLIILIVFRLNFVYFLCVVTFQ